MSESMTNGLRSLLLSMETHGDGGQGRGETVPHGWSGLPLPILVPLLPECYCSRTFATLWVLTSPTLLYRFNHLTLDRRETRRRRKVVPYPQTTTSF